MSAESFPPLLREFLDGPAWDLVEIHDLDLEYLEDWADDWKAPWGLDDHAASALWAFAQDGTGGMVCLWTYDDQEFDDAPVVHLGSEGECAMLGGNLGEFLALTALGLDPFAIADGYVEAPSGEPPHEEALGFLEARGVDRPDSVANVLQRAQQDHPDIDEWVSARLR